MISTHYIQIRYWKWYAVWTVVLSCLKKVPFLSYDGWPESIQPFWISREPVAWPRCNLAACQRRPYYASVNSHSPVGPVSQQWDAVDWACVLCDRRIHNDQASRSASSPQCVCPFYSSRAGFCGKASHHPGLSAPLQPIFGSLWILAFPKAKITTEKEEICKCACHTVHKLSQWRLTADWLAPGRVTVHGCAVRSPLADCRVTLRPRDQFSRYSKWLDTFRTALIHGCVELNNGVTYKCELQKKVSPIITAQHTVTLTLRHWMLCVCYVTYSVMLKIPNVTYMWLLICSRLTQPPFKFWSSADH